MMGEELDRFIDSLPDIDTYKRPGGRCYAFSYSGENSYSVLLDTGRLVNSGICVKHGRQTEEEFKKIVKESLKQKGEVTFIGVGIVHTY